MILFHIKNRSSVEPHTTKSYVTPDSSLPCRLSWGRPLYRAGRQRCHSDHQRLPEIAVCNHTTEQRHRQPDNNYTMGKVAYYIDGNNSARIIKNRRMDKNGLY